MNRAGGGRFAMKPVKERRIAQISGKMLIASKRTIVGAMNSHATARSDSPVTRRARRGAALFATRSAKVEMFSSLVIAIHSGLECDPPARRARRGTFPRGGGQARDPEITTDPCLPA